MFELIAERDHFESLRQDWTELYRRSGNDNVFFTHSWISHWLRSFGQPRHVVAVTRRERELTAGVLLDRNGSREASCVDEHSDWAGILSHGVPRELLEELARYGLGRLLVHGPNTDEHNQLIQQAAHGSYFVIARHPHVTRAVDVTQPLDRYLETRSKKLRSSLRRKLRRIEREHPGVELKALDRPEHGADAIAVIEAVESESWKLEAGTAIICSAREREFYRGLFHLNDPATRPRMYVLTTNSGPVAFCLGVVHKRRFYSLKTSYRRSLFKLSPGLLLYCHMIDHLAAEGETDVIELLGRDAEWKRDLGTSADSWITYELRARSLSACCYVAAYQHVRPRAKLLLGDQRMSEVRRHLLRLRLLARSGSAWPAS